MSGSLGRDEAIEFPPVGMSSGSVLFPAWFTSVRMSSSGFGRVGASVSWFRGSVCTGCSNCLAGTASSVSEMFFMSGEKSCSQ